MGWFYNSNPDDELPSAREIFAAAWAIFSEMFPTNESRVEALYERVATAGNVSCRRCGCVDLLRKYGSRVAKCSGCKAEVHFTSGTFLHGKKALGAIFAVIWLKELGVFFSKTQIHEHTKVASSTAWQIVTEIDMLISNRLESDASSIALDSALFQSVVCKRSFATPAFKHPRSEQFEMEKEVYGPPPPGPASAPVAPPARSIAVIAGLMGEEKLVFDLISAGPITFESLLEATSISNGPLSTILVQLELEDLIERQPGDVYTLFEPKPMPQPRRPAKAIAPQNQVPPGVTPGVANPAPAANRPPVGPPAPAVGIPFHSAIPDETTESQEELLTEIVWLCGSIGRTLHGISRKYLQLHLASFWCSVDRKSWPPGSLFNLVLGSEAPNRSAIRSFVTPLSVKMIFA